MCWSHCCPLCVFATAVQDDKFSASWGEIRFHLYTRQPSPSGGSSGVQTRSRAESFASSTASAATTPRSGASELSAFRDVCLSDEESVGSED